MLKHFHSAEIMVVARYVYQMGFQQVTRGTLRLGNVKNVDFRGYYKGVGNI